MSQNIDPMRVDASPEKRFFIDMLTKDIELIPAVLDLVDNSVDGAQALRGNESFDGLWVNLEVNPDGFGIRDNCGGIDLHVARNYAFRFGRPSEFHGVAGSVGQFGVGMKRALFKLGREFVVESRTQTASFSLHVNVEEWETEPGPEWTFRFTNVDEHFTPTDDQPAGTDIMVSPLHDSVAEDFQNSNVVGTLRAQLRLRHQGALERGMKMTLNGDPLSSFVPALQSSAVIQPIHTVSSLEESYEDGSGTVHIRLLAGVVPAGREDRDLDDGDGEQFRTDGDAGWYVFCNNRMLLAADRTSLTGWGHGAPAYHPQYRRFRGYVYLESATPELLPWNTTKTGVDQDSRVWRRVAAEMRIALANVCAMLNKVKVERQFGETDEERPVTVALEAARPVPLKQVPMSSQLKFPQPPRPKTRVDMRKIQYSVERIRYDRTAEVLETTSIADVGRGTFDYFYEHQVGEDD